MADAAARRPRHGVEQWSNPGNGFFVCQLHYSADPAKRDPKWKAEAQKNFPPRAWKREYEIDWAAPAGEPVIPEYTESWHVRDCEVDPRLRLLRFWDFGFDSPVVLFAQLSLEGQLRILRELCPFNTTLQALADAAQAMAIELLGQTWLATQGPTSMSLLDVGGADEPSFFAKPQRSPGLQPEKPDLRVWDAGDPAGTNTYDTGCSVDLLAAQGIHVHTVRPGTEVSYDRLRQRFARSVLVRNELEPAIVISPRCPSLRAALSGGFHRSQTPPYKPVKTHPAKDLVDSLRYGNDNLDAAATHSPAAMQQLAASDRLDVVGQQREGLGAMLG